MEEKNYYIYNNGFQYEIFDSFAMVLKLTSATIVSLCTSFVNAETGENIINLANINNDNLVIAKDVLDEISNPNSGGYTCHSITKNELIKNITVMEITTTTASFIGDKCDVTPILIAESLSGIVFCADFHEIANACSRGIPYIYKIHKDELKKSNGINNYKKMHIKKRNNLIKEIINN